MANEYYFEDPDLVTDKEDSGQEVAEYTFEPVQSEVKDEKTDSFLQSAADVIILDPLREIGRGLAMGTSSFYRKLDGAAKLVENTTGLKRGGIFEDWANETQAMAESIPETPIVGPLKAIWEFGGQAIPMITEFATASKLTGGGGIVTQMAVTEAIEEYEKTEEPIDLVTGGIKGAIKGRMIKGLPQALELMKRTGKRAGGAFLQWVTNSKKAADDFMKNPKKYNVNPFSKVKTTEEVRLENKTRLDTKKAEFTSKRSQMKLERDLNRHETNLKLQQAREDLQLTNTSIKETAGVNGQHSLEAAQQKALASKAASDKALQEKTIFIYDDAAKKFKQLRTEHGENVRVAVENTINKNPGAAVKFDIVNNRVKKTIAAKSPYKKGKLSQKFKENTVLAKDDVARSELQAFMKEINSKKADGGFGVGYLQEVKNVAKNKANQYYKAGNNRMGDLYSSIADDVNPAKLVEEVPSLSKEFSLIAEANKTYSSFMNKYERALKYHFDKLPNGELVSNPNKALSAISQGNKHVTRQMDIADKALPKDFQIMPKLNTLLKEADDMALLNKNNIKEIRNKIRIEKQRASAAVNKSRNNLMREQTKIRFEEGQKIKNELSEFDKISKDTLTQMEKEYAGVEQFYDNLGRLRKIGANTAGGAGILQHILGYRALSGGGLLNIGGVVGLAPAVGSSAIKGAILSTRAISPAIKSAAESKLAQQFMGGF